MERLKLDIIAAWNATGHFLEKLVVLILTLLISIFALCAFVLTWVRTWVEQGGKVPKWLLPQSLVKFVRRK